MIDLATYWSYAVEWFSQLVERTQMLDPLLLTALAVPCVLALICRSLTAFLLTVLLAIAAISAFGDISDLSYRWVITILMVAAGLLAILQAVILRRARRQLHDATFNMGTLQLELGELREKSEREAYWRKADERASQQPPP